MKKTLLVIVFFFIISIVFAGDWVRQPLIKNSTISYNTYNSYNTTLGMQNGSDAHFNKVNLIGLNVTGGFNSSFDGNTLFIDTANNRIGIGTATPRQTLDITGKLQVTSTIVSQSSMQANTLTTYSGVDLKLTSRDTTHGVEIGANWGNIPIASFLETGNVGIGATNPSHKLTVEGDVNISGLIINDAIYCESSELIDQTFATAGVRYGLDISNVDEGNGISMNTGTNGTNITINTNGVYHLVAQPQVKAGAVGGGKGDFHMWIEKLSSDAWDDIPDSNIELSLGTNEEDVIVLATTLRLNQGEKLKLIASVSDNNVLLHAQSPEGEPVIPSIIFTMYRVGS